MKKTLKKIKRFIWSIFDLDIYFPIQQREKVEWCGDSSTGFFVCTEYLNRDSVVYSFGVGEDISFDEALIKKFGCTVFGFDPTPKSIRFIETKTVPQQFKFYDYGLYSYDGNLKFYLPENPEYVSGTTFNRWEYDETKIRPIEVPVKKLSTIAAQLGHKTIDLLKMDIEGSEYEVVDDIIRSGLHIKQLLIEFHHRFPTIGFAKSKKTIRKLNNAGFKIAAISESFEEFTFIRKSTES